jgi:lauroyl/myristoyl acyltransferase
VSATDFLVLVGLAVLTPLAWLLPERAWRRTGGFFAPLAGRVMARQTRESVARIRELGGKSLGETGASQAGGGQAGGGQAGGGPAPEAVQDELMATYVEDILHVLRQLGPGGWSPEIDVAGAEHIDGALSAGKGVILWISHFAFYSLAGKIALARAGYRVSHLSHPRHGFSSTRFGMAVLNPIRNRAEDRYLEARVFLGLATSRAALGELTRRLAANEVVSITAREASGRPLETRFLDGTIGFAAGAPSLAHKTGAALVPVHVMAGGGGYRVIVEAPLELDRGLSKGEAYVDLVRQYAARLEPHVLACPGQWRGWHYH